ncbi:VQ protein [Dillenia turbinata]|uniref:VQ protein n=1 Tax=Dillenia turbinata TaxID=194707 RepID=A0AAN8Z5B4_9MAGN
MSQLNDDNQQPKRQLQALKINKESYLIKKPSSSSSSSSSSGSSLSNVMATSSRPQQQRHPVIIYTHSPKIIHTHPKDFMALVQKLTGLSQSSEDMAPLKSENNNESWMSEDDSKHGNDKGIINDDNESSSVITDENNCSFGDVPVNSSCFVPPIFDASNPNLMSHHIPIFSSSQTFPNYSDCLFFPPNVRRSISSSSMKSMKDFQEF